MNPLILSLICLVIVGITANLIKLIKESKILLQLSILPCVYLVIYGCYLIFGPIDLYKDGTENFFNQNPNKDKYHYEKEHVAKGVRNYNQIQ